MGKINKIFFDAEDYKRLIPKISAEANKYSRGVCNIFAGSVQYPGAAVLTSLSAQNAGAGYVCLFTDNYIKNEIAITYPSVVVKNLNTLCPFDVKKQNYENCSFVVGPGMPQDDQATQKAIKNICKYAKSTLLIDGGALNYVTKKGIQKQIIKRGNRGLETIFTPHYGEAKKIIKNIDKKFDFKSRGHIAKMAYIISNEFGCVCVLKGPNTVICNKNNIHVYTNGSQELSVAGSGDVLAGIIGSVASTGNLDAFDCCCLGVHIHAAAGKMASFDLTNLGVNSVKINEYVPDAISSILEN